MDRNVLTVNLPFLNFTQFMKCSLQIGRLRECERMLVASGTSRVAERVEHGSSGCRSVLWCSGSFDPFQNTRHSRHTGMQK